jgi:hypothetical protein
VTCFMILIVSQKAENIKIVGIPASAHHSYGSIFICKVNYGVQSNSV